MKNTILVIAFCIALIFACNVKDANSPSKYLNQENIAKQNFVLNISKDTVIKTQAGLVIDYKANNIEAESQIVHLEIKEAFELKDILKAGLTTQTKDGILSSDGMFKISTKEKSSIKKPLQIKVPTNAYNFNMQLFKGFEENGKIVWDNPKQIEINKPNGKDLFVKNCSSCHAIGKQLTGGDLAHVEERWHKRKNLIAFIKNSGQFLKGKILQDSANEVGVFSDEIVSPLPKIYSKNNTDRFIQNTTNSRRLEVTKPKETIIRKYEREHIVERDLNYAKFLFCQYNKQAMTSFDGILSNQDIEAILEYVKSENRFYPKFQNSFDECLNLFQKYVEQVSKMEKFENEKGNKPMLQFKNNPDNQDLLPTNNNNEPITAIQSFNYNNLGATYYQIEIETYGWYNIDVIMNANNATDISLKATVDDEHSKRYKVYIIIPQTKSFTEGNLLNNSKNEYSFYSNDGKLRLPLDLQGYIFAIGEENEKIFYGLQPFTISLQNNISIKIAPIEKEELHKKLSNLKLDGFNLKLEQNKNYKEQSDAEKELIIIQEKLKKCQCLQETDYKLLSAMK